MRLRRFWDIVGAVVHQYPKSPTGKRLAGPVLASSLPKLDPIPTAERNADRVLALRIAIALIAGAAALELLAELVGR